MLTRQVKRDAVSGLSFELEVHVVVAEIGSVARQSDLGRIEWRSGYELSFCLRGPAGYQPHRNDVVLLCHEVR
jgi:hypothetical protein